MPAPLFHFHHSVSTPVPCLQETAVTPHFLQPRGSSYSIYQLHGECQAVETSPILLACQRTRTTETDLSVELREEGSLGFGTILNCFLPSHGVSGNAEEQGRRKELRKPTGADDVAFWSTTRGAPER